MDEQRISTRDQRERQVIALLDERLEAMRVGFTDELRYDRHEFNGALRTRAVAWRLGRAEFLFTYHEVPEVPGSAIYRARSQPHVPGTIADAWQDLPSLGHLDAALRAAKKGGAKVPETGAKTRTQHEGDTPDGLILVGLTGSHAYGLNHTGFLDPVTGQQFPPSDVDTRGVFVEPTLAVLALVKPRSLVEQRDTDTTYDEIERFLALCLKGNPERLEMLASKKTLVTPWGQALIDRQSAFLSKRLIKTYGGYAKQQLYRIERKQVRTNKPAMHLIRLMLTGIHILREGVVSPDMAAWRDELLAIRFGQMSLDDAFAWHRALEIDFARAAEATCLPEEPDHEGANRLLLDVRRAHLDWAQHQS